MSSVTVVGAPVPVAYFSEELPSPSPSPGAARLRLAAAVVCRGTPDRVAAAGGRGPTGWLRRIRHRLWLRLGPLGLDVHTRGGRPLFGGAGAVSSGPLGPAGPAEAYYDEGGRVLRVLGRVYPLPPGERTFVLLVDAAGRRAASPRVTVRTVSTPVLSVPPPDDWVPPPPGTAVTHMIIGEDPAWAAALRADPDVGAFLEGGAGS